MQSTTQPTTRPRQPVSRLLAGLALLGTLAFADTASADADRKATEELVQLVTPPETYTAMIDQMSRQMIASIAQSGAKLPPDADKKIIKAVTDVLPYKELIGWTIDVYASKYTTEEIKQLTAFYKTPVGKKTAKLMPELSGEVGKKMGPILMERMPAAMKKAGLTP